MGDLISRSALMEVLEKYKFGAISNDAERDYTKETVLNFVNEQPTAYDVEKVEEQIEEMNMNYFLTIANTGSEKLDIAYGYTSDALNKAIDIVKGGGVE